MIERIIRQRRQRRLPGQYFEKAPREEPEDLESLSLSGVDWKPAGSDRDSSDKDCENLSASRKVVFQGQVLKLQCELKKLRGYRDTFQDDYRFRLRNGTGIVTEDVCLERKFLDGPISASTVILRDDPRKELVPGVGIALYRRAMIFLQESADQRREPITHYVRSAPFVSTTPMSFEKWDKLFLPILAENEYEELEGLDNWIKTYNPRS